MGRILPRKYSLEEDACALPAPSDQCGDQTRPPDVVDEVIFRRLIALAVRRFFMGVNCKRFAIKVGLVRFTQFMDYLVLLSSIVLGAATVFGLRLSDPRHVKILNAFTGAYLLTLVMMHLLPDLYEPEPGLVLKPLVIGGFILFGFFLQIAMDSISMGIEHGHAHEIHGHMAFGILGGLCIHAFVEAMALGQSPQHQTAHDLAAHRFLLGQRRRS